MEEATLPPGVGRRIGFFNSLANLFFGATLAFLMGTVVAGVGGNVALVILAGAGAIGVLRFLRKAPVLALFVWLAFFFFGSFYFYLFQNIREYAWMFPEGESEIKAVIVNEPRQSEAYQYFDVSILAPYRGRVRVVTGAFPELHYGEEIIMRGGVHDEGLPRDLPVIFPETLAVLRANQGNPVRETLLSFKRSIIAGFARVLPPESAALLGGITLGDQSGFSKSFKEEMKRSGTTHLVALSGYNIAILVYAVGRALGRFLRRRMVFFASILFIVLFVVMVGAEASVVRAALMGFLLLLAREASGLYSFRNAVTFAAFVMVLFDPTVAALNLGFQLSFASLLGIVYLAPALAARVGFDYKASLWKESALATIAAQLAVAPLLIAQFGSVSLSAIFANILILAFVPATMALGFLLALVNFFSLALGTLFAWFVNIPLFYERFIIGLFSRLTLPVGDIFFHWVVFVCYYGVLIGFIILTREKTEPLTS